MMKWTVAEIQSRHAQLRIRRLSPLSTTLLRQMEAEG